MAASRAVAGDRRRRSWTCRRRRGRGQVGVVAWGAGVRPGLPLGAGLNYGSCYRPILGVDRGRGIPVNHEVQGQIR
uniref:Uncharacterized protein n=1 Tax=Arundo donax TaxID=35708 RepID=A0A0A9E2S4_ARUDO